VTIKKTIARLKTKFTPAYERLLAKPFVQLIVRIGNKAGGIAAGDLAGNVSFNVILSLLPLLLGAMAIFAYFFNTSEIQAQLTKFFSDNLPTSVAGLQSNLSRIADARTTLGVVGVLGSVWTGINIFSSLDDAINRAWSVPTQRPLFRAKLIELGMAVGCGLLLILSIGFSSVLAFFPHLELLKNPLVEDGGYVASFGLMFVLFLVIYKVFPNTKTTWREAFPGAFLAAVAFEMARQFFFFFAGNVADLEIIYGSLTTVILFMTFIYYASTVAIFGAIFSVEYNKLRQEIADGRYHVIKPGVTAPF